MRNGNPGYRLRTSGEGQAHDDEKSMKSKSNQIRMRDRAVHQYTLHDGPQIPQSANRFAARLVRLRETVKDRRHSGRGTRDLSKILMWVVQLSQSSRRK